MGSGKSFGKQSNNVSQTQGAKPAQNATPATPATPAGAAPQGRPWGAMLGGLAAGLGLAWLASSMGFGEELGQFMMFGLIALVIMMAVGYFMRRRATAQKPCNRHKSFGLSRCWGNTPRTTANDPIQCTSQCDPCRFRQHDWLSGQRISTHLVNPRWF